jgi:hypothetical protein
MTFDELKELNTGDRVVITKVDDKITEYHNHQVGDELIFLDFNNQFGLGHEQVANFIRESGDIRFMSHFSYEICHYIELKSELRNKKLNNLGI